MASDLYSNKTGLHSASLLNNLPRALPIFLGREAEIVQVKQLLEEKHLVTLFGTDGVGKTSLALQVARELTGQFGDGIFFVTLDFIASSESISDAIAKNLGIKINPRLDLLEQFLAELSLKKNILLILDGLESSFDPPLFLTQLIDHIPSLKIIITARERLGIEDESAVELHGLALPERDSADVESYPSVQLFLQYARNFPDFEADSAAIGHICRLVDGMPLAIVLSSAWAATLSCEQIANHIEHSLSLHSTGKSSGEYESMLAILDSIWDFLSETEKRTLMGLSVFKGGFSHHAASKIAGASSFFLDAVLNKKIIQSNKPQRYAMHTSILQYLQQKLQANPVLATDVEIRHGSYYLGLLRDSEISLGQIESTSLLEDILADADNIRFAWQLTVAVGNLRLVQSALSPWMSTMWDRGWFKDAIDALELLTIRLSELSGDDPEVVLIYAQTKKFLGEFYFLIGDYESGLRELQNGLQRINESDDSVREEPETYRLLGSYVGGRNRDSKEMYQLGLVLAEKVGDLSLVYKFINRLAAEAYMEADYKGAIPIAEHALEIARQLDDKGKIVQSLNDLGNLHFANRKYPRAKELLTEALAHLPEIDKSLVLEHTIFNTLGRVLTASGEYQYASQIFSQGLDLIKDAANADLWAVEMLVSSSELLNSMKEKSVAIALVNLLVYHPSLSTDVKARAVRLREVLTAERIQPDNRSWSLGQISRILGDVKFILDQKNNPQ